MQKDYYISNISIVNNLNSLF